jgi:hypothetical protein
VSDIASDNARDLMSDIAYDRLSDSPQPQPQPQPQEGNQEASDEALSQSLRLTPSMGLVPISRAHPNSLGRGPRSLALAPLSGLARPGGDVITSETYDSNVQESANAAGKVQQSGSMIHAPPARAPSVLR